MLGTNSLTRSALIALPAVALPTVACWLWRRRTGSHEDAEERALRALDEAHASADAKTNEAEYCVAVEKWVKALWVTAGGKQLPSALRLAARAQHLERKAIPRASYPEGRPGYLSWRAAVKKRQGERIEALLGAFRVSLGNVCINRVGDLVSKKLPLLPHGKENGDAEMQCLEDAACLVFLQDLNTFAEGKDDAKMVDILAKTWRKMSRSGHNEALKLEYSPRMLGCLVEAMRQAEGLLPQDPPLPVPTMRDESLVTLRSSWHAAKEKSPRFGAAFYDELRSLDPLGYARDLGEVLRFPVCSEANVEKLIDTLLDLIGAPTERFATLVRDATLLGQLFGGLRLRHADHLRMALVNVMSHRTDERRVWESFGYTVAAQLAPFLVMSDPGVDFCAAVATPLPTPGSGPTVCFTIAAAVALIEMSLGVAQRKKSCIDSEVLLQVAVLRGDAIRCAADDTHAYCGLLATAIFDKGGDDVRRKWLARASDAPLKTARVGLEGLATLRSNGPAVLAAAPSTHGEMIVARTLLLATVAAALATAEMNISARAGPSDLRDALTELQQTLAQEQKADFL